MRWDMINNTHLNANCFRPTVCVRMEDMDHMEQDLSVPMELSLTNISSDVRLGTL